MLVLQISGDGPGLSRPDVFNSPVQGRVGGIGLRRQGHQHRRVRQGNTGLGQAHHQCGVHRRFHHGDDLRPGKAHVLAGTHQQPPAHRRQIPRLQQTAQVVDGGVRIGTTHGLLKGAHQVVVLVPVFVVAHGAFLGQLPGGFQGHLNMGAACVTGQRGKFHGVHGLAHVPAAMGGDVGTHPLLRQDGPALFLCQYSEGSLHGFLNLPALHRLELKHGRAA